METEEEAETFIAENEQEDDTEEDQKSKQVNNKNNLSHLKQSGVQYNLNAR